MSNSIWGGYNNHGSQVNSNTTNDLWRPSNNIVNNNVQVPDNTLNNSANPFRQIQLSVNNGSAFGNIFFPHFYQGISIINLNCQGDHLSGIFKLTGKLKQEIAKQKLLFNHQKFVFP